MSKFIVMWDMLGLECVINIDEFEQEENDNLFKMIATGKSQTNGLSVILTALKLRARYNNQRFYEIYAIQATDGISDEDINSMFENAPQQSAETIRRIGVKIYSDRLNTGRVVIT